MNYLLRFARFLNLYRIILIFFQPCLESFFRGIALPLEIGLYIPVLLRFEFFDLILTLYYDTYRNRLDPARA